MRVDSCPAIRATTSRSSPFRGYSVTPVPRKLCADLGREPRLSGAALDHLERTHPRHPPLLKHLSPPGLCAPEERAAAVLVDPGGLEESVDVFLGRCGGPGPRCTARPSLGAGRTTVSLACSSPRPGARLRHRRARICRRGLPRTRGHGAPRGSRRRCPRGGRGSTHWQSFAPPHGLLALPWSSFAPLFAEFSESARTSFH